MENSALECPICQQSLLASSASPPPSPRFELVSSPSSPVCTPCGHIFHKACIAEWFRFRRRQHQNDNIEGNSSTRTTFRCSCPTCRKSIAYHKIIRVYLPSTSTSPFPSGPPPSPPEAFHGEPSLSVAEHVRRFNQRTQAPEPEGSSASRPSTQSNSQIYNEFFTIYNAINEDDYEAHSESSSTSPAPPASQFTCQNFDCIALQSVYQVLSKEFKILQRRLQLETEVSKMKSVVVAGLQRDLNFCRKNYNTGRLTGDLARTIGIIILSVFTAWLLGCAALFIFKPF